MPIHIILLVLFAALLHASWNALLRSGADRLWSMTVMCIAIAITSVVAAVFMMPPAIESWGYAVLSGLLHVGYNLFLVRSYRVGDLGQVYPISRGSSPVLITLGAAVFAGESITPGELVGIALVSGGIISLAFRGRSLSVPSLPYALGTGGFIAAYSVVDGIGASVRPGTVTALVGGLVSLLAYGMVIYAMNEAPLGAVSALRETSVLFAALIGYVFLGETLTARRILACVVIASGTLIIG